MEQDIAIASVADTILRTRRTDAPGAAAAAAAPAGPLVERFESMHQKVASAAAGVGAGGGGSSLSSQPWKRRLRRPAMWAGLAALLVGALAVWMRPALALKPTDEDDDEDGGGSGGSSPAALSPLRVAGIAAAAGLVVGGVDLSVSR
jgi:hypothetical protein